MYKTKVTSQGTISIPAALRKKYQLQAGDQLVIEDTGKIVVSKMPSIEDVRAVNRQYLKNAKSSTYKSGDGMAAHVKEKYGQA